MTKKRLILALLALPIVLLFAVGALPLVYSKFPELFGHYRFYRTCKNLEAGTSLTDTRRSMSAFLEVGKTFHPAAGIESQLFTAVVPEIQETTRERATRVVFIPDARDRADWCVVYLDSSGTKVARVEIAPD